MTTAQSDITSLQGDMTTAQSDITSLDSDMTTAQGNISSLQSDMSTAQSDITSLDSDMTTAQSDIASLENNKANKTGTYNNLVAGNLYTIEGYEEKSAYISRKSGGAKVYAQLENDKVIGGTIVWNQLVNINSTTVTVQFGHVYFANISEVESIGISNGTPINITDGADNIIDLTLAFGSAIANYISTLETATPGAGVAWFRALFPKSYYAYDAGSLQSVQTSAHVMRDADDEIIGNYQLDPSLTLRGVPMLDGNNKLYYDGDTYESDGTVTRNYGRINLGSLTWTYIESDSEDNYSYFTAQNQSIFFDNQKIICEKYAVLYPPMGGTAFSQISTDKVINHGTGNNGRYIKIRDTAYTSAEDFKAAMSGVYLICESSRPTTETAAPYQNPQIVDIAGTEQYIDAGNRDVDIPVGSNTWYFDNLKAKLENLPWTLDMIATVLDDYTADTNLVSNDFRIINNTLYKITASINEGQTITPGTNAQKTNICEVLKTLLGT